MTRARVTAGGLACAALLFVGVVLAQEPLPPLPDPDIAALPLLLSNQPIEAELLADEPDHRYLLLARTEEDLLIQVERISGDVIPMLALITLTGEVVVKGRSLDLFGTTAEAAVTPSEDAWLIVIVARDPTVSAQASGRYTLLLTGASSEWLTDLIAAPTGTAGAVSLNMLITATPSPTFTSTPTLTRTHTPTSTLTPSSTLTPTLTLSPSRTPTATPTFTATFTPSRTLTPSDTPQPTETWTPTRTHTLFPTLTPTRTSPPLPTPTPTLQRCAGLLPARLRDGMQGRITPGDPNNLRAEPDADSARLGQIPAGGTLTVIGDPVCSSRWIWRLVEYSGILGWTVEGSNATYYIDPIVPDGATRSFSDDYPRQCRNSLPTRLEPGMRILAIQQVRLRDTPTSSAGTALVRGTDMIITGLPRCARFEGNPERAELLWWPVRILEGSIAGSEGWISESSSSGYSVEYDSTP